MNHKRGRPRQGKQRKEHVSIRVEADIRAALIRRYGSIQKWVDLCLHVEGFFNRAS